MPNAAAITSLVSELTEQKVRRLLVELLLATPDVPQPEPEWPRPFGVRVMATKRRRKRAAPQQAAAPAPAPAAKAKRPKRAARGSRPRKAVDHPKGSAGNGADGESWAATAKQAHSVEARLGPTAIR